MQINAVSIPTNEHRIYEGLWCVGSVYDIFVLWSFRPTFFAPIQYDGNQLKRTISFIFWKKNKYIHISLAWLNRVDIFYVQRVGLTKAIRFEEKNESKQMTRRNHFYFFDTVVIISGFSSLVFLSTHMTQTRTRTTIQCVRCCFSSYIVSHQTTLTLVSKHLRHTTFICPVCGRRVVMLYVCIIVTLGACCVSIRTARCVNGLNSASFRFRIQYVISW